MNKPRIWTLDIETAPINAYAWGLWDQNIGIDMVKDDWSILAFCAKRLGSSAVVYADVSQHDPANMRDDSTLLQYLWDILDDADIIIGQNVRKFDIKKIKARMFKHRMKPYSPIRVVDTQEQARRLFAFTSNKLAWTSQYSGLQKLEHRQFPGFKLWDECLKGNPKAWAVMKRYNIRDVKATEKLYLQMRPWMDNHPNLGAYSDGDQHNCPACGSKHVQQRGTTVTQQGRYIRYHCQECGSWSRGKVRTISTTRQRKLLK